MDTDSLLIRDKQGVYVGIFVMHSCRLLMKIPGMERHRVVHVIIAIGILKGVR